MSLFEILKIINSIVLVFLVGWLAFGRKAGSHTVLSIMAATVFLASALFNAGSVGIESYDSWKEKKWVSTNRQGFEIDFADNLKQEIEGFLSLHQGGIQNLVNLAFTLKPENVNKLPHQHYIGDGLIDSDGTYLAILKKEYDSIRMLSESIESLKSTYAKGLDKETYHSLVKMSEWLSVLEKTVLSILKYNEIERQILLVRLEAESSNGAKSEIAKEYLARLQKPREQLWSTEVTYTKGIVAFYNAILETLSQETRVASRLNRLDEEAIFKGITKYIRDMSKNQGRR